MGRQFWRPSNMLYPVPVVLVSCMDEEGRANIMTAGWAGTLCSDPVMVGVGIRKERYSHDIIERTGEFVINLTTEKLAFATDYAGVKSGRDVDKFRELGLTQSPSRIVKAPGVAESPVSLECRVREILRLGTHDFFVGEVVSTDVDDSYIDEKGKFDLDSAGLITYSHGEYFSLGRKLGTFGYSVRKPKKSAGGGARKQDAAGNSNPGCSVKSHSAGRRSAANRSVTSRSSNSGSHTGASARNKQMMRRGTAR